MLSLIQIKIYIRPKYEKEELLEIKKSVRGILVI